jgi:hypothetical protein
MPVVLEIIFETSGLLIAAIALVFASRPNASSNDRDVEAEHLLKKT